MKLFLTLFRLKTASSFHAMESLFGWGSSSLQEWYDLIINMMQMELHYFHEGFVNFMGEDWQQLEMRNLFIYLLHKVILNIIFTFIIIYIKISPSRTTIR